MFSCQKIAKVSFNIPYTDTDKRFITSNSLSVRTTRPEFPGESSTFIVISTNWHLVTRCQFVLITMKVPDSPGNSGLVVLTEVVSPVVCGYAPLVISVVFGVFDDQTFVVGYLVSHLSCVAMPPLSYLSSLEYLMTRHL